MQGQQAAFGGISGMDHDPSTGKWLLLSDDRSERKPSRYYRATLSVTPTSVGPLKVEQEVSLVAPDGRLYRSREEGGMPPDPEALRLDPCGDGLVWSSEGDRSVGVVSAIHRAGRDGRYRGLLFSAPTTADANQSLQGPRDNRSLEGIAYTPDGGRLWVAMESPLYEDGPLPTLQEGAPVRFTELDRSGRVLGQYVYQVGPIPLAAQGGQRRADNGVSEILAFDADTLLVVERAGREVETGVFLFSVRLYEVRRGLATNVAGWLSLQQGGYRPLHKRLLLDLDLAVPGGVDNIEAAAWGPLLPNGHPTLVLASDDNFSPRQVTQFLAFEVRGAPAVGRSTCLPKTP